MTKDSELDSRAVGRRCLSMALRIHERRETDPWEPVEVACTCGEADLAAAALGRQLEHDHHWRLDLLALQHRICLDQVDADGALEALVSLPHKEPYEESPEFKGKPFFFYRILRDIESVIDVGLKNLTRNALNKAPSLLEEIDEKKRPEAWAYLGSLMARCGMRKAANEAFAHAGPVGRWTHNSKLYLALRKARKHRLAAAYARDIARRGREELRLGPCSEDRFARALVWIAGECIELKDNTAARRYLEQARHLYAQRPLVPKDRYPEPHLSDEYIRRSLHSIAALFGQAGDNEGMQRSLYASVGVEQRRIGLSRKPALRGLTSEERLLLSHCALAEASLVALEANASVFSRELADKAMAGIDLERRIYVERHRLESSQSLAALASGDAPSQLQLPSLTSRRPTAEELAWRSVPYFEPDETAASLAATYAELGESDLVDRMLRQLARGRDELGRSSIWLYGLEGVVFGYLRWGDVVRARTALVQALNAFLALTTNSDYENDGRTWPTDVEWLALRLADEPTLDAIRNKLRESALRELHERRFARAHVLDHVLDYHVVSGDLAGAITIARDAHRDPSIREEALAASLAMIAERLLTDRLPSVTFGWNRGGESLGWHFFHRRDHMVTDGFLRGVDGRELRRLEDVLDSLA